jgi:glucose-1-phosphate thymidylyltransferase
MPIKLRSRPASAYSPARGELENTDLIPCGRVGSPWLVWAEAMRGLIRAHSAHGSKRPAFVQTLARRQGMKICCPEGIACHMGYVTETRFRVLAGAMKKSGYGAYLETLVEADDAMVA